MRDVYYKSEIFIEKIGCLGDGKEGVEIRSMNNF